MTDYSHLKTGFFKAQVVSINPTIDELEELLGESLDKEPSYTWEKDGHKNCIIDVYLKSVFDDIFKYSIHLKDTPVLSETGKSKYINCVGDTQWVESEDQLWDSMVNFEKITSWISPSGIISEKYQKGSKPKDKEIIGSKQPRIAIKGEEYLLHLRKHLLGINPYDSDVYLFCNMSSLFSGDFSKLRKDIDKSEYHFVAFAYIDNDFKQKIWKYFLPLSLMRDINDAMNISYYSQKAYNEWKTQVLGNYGINGHYNLDKLSTFTEEFFKGKRQIAEDSDEY